MGVDKDAYQQILTESKNQAVLVAVSKTKPLEDIQALYNLGHRDFGENYVQELLEKQRQLPSDIRWHFIGHLQSNKVKLLAPFVHLIHGVDSLKLLKEINKEGRKYGRSISCLLQVFIAREETKFGLDETELDNLVAYYLQHKQELDHIKIEGLMGMASFSNDTNLVRSEFKHLKQLFQKINTANPPQNIVLNTLSMGMSGDYRIALEEGSTLIRVGSLIFGSR